MAETLKEGYQKQLTAFFVLNVGIFFAVTLLPSTGVAAEIVQIGILRLVIGAVAPIAALVLVGLLTSGGKAVLVFWKWKNPLPGCEAFSKHLHKDPRINIEVIEKRFAPMPTDGEAQNRLWFRIYKKHEESNAVRDAHKHFLMFRDMTAASFVFFLLLGLPSLYLIDSLKLRVLYFVIMLAQIIITSRVAQNHAVRMVRTVLAEESVAD